MIAATMEPVHGFQSPLHFKAKFQPVYEPLYLTYPDPAAPGLSPSPSAAPICPT